LGLELVMDLLVFELVEDLWVQLQLVLELV
jgi:hypothetical protein